MAAPRLVEAEPGGRGCHLQPTPPREAEVQRHSPVKPIWICAACAHPWPCGQARLDLLVEYDGDRRTMAIDLADLLYAATNDLTRLYPKPPDGFEMYGRFLGWIRRGQPGLTPNYGYFDQ